MKKILILTSVLFLFGIIASPGKILAAGAWTAVGSAGFTGDQAYYTNLAFNSATNEPYAAYVDDNTRKVTVKKFNGSNWEMVGSAGFNEGQTDYAAITFNPKTDEPYVIYVDNSTFMTTIEKFDGSDWVSLGTPAKGWGQSFYTKLAFNPETNEPYIAYNDNDTHHYWVKATVIKFNGSDWETVGPFGFSEGQIGTIGFAFNPSTKEPYVVYRDYGNSKRATVMKFNGSNWETIGSAGFSSGVANYTNIAFNPATSEPYVVFMDDDNSNKATVMKFNGSDWVTVGSAGFSPGQVSDLNIAFNPVTNEPYVVFIGDDNSNKVIVMKYDGSSWAELGSIGFSVGQADTTVVSLAFNPSTSEPYVSYVDANNDSKVTVVKFESESVATPTASPAGGIYNSSQSVSLSTSTPDADIYYTTDNSTPTESSTHYTDPINISSAMVIKAIATKSEMKNSGVMSESYTILSPECSASTTCGNTCSYGGVNYNTVLIGTQCWFKENINAGAMIGNLEISDDIAPILNNPSSVQKWCFNDTLNNCNNEGGLYSWAEANALPNSCNSTHCSVSTSRQGICPSGWHIPSDGEFFTLENYLTTSGQTCDSERRGWDCADAGDKLRLGGSSGFDAISAGNHETNGALSFFDRRQPSIHFWTSSELVPHPDGGWAWRRELVSVDGENDFVSRDRYINSMGYSIRCLADTKESESDQGAQKYNWNLSGDVMPVPPYGSGDIPGSDTGSRLIVNQPDGVVEATINGTMRGLLPNTDYTVYLSKKYTKYVPLDIKGSYEWLVLGTYSHDIVIDTQNPDGTFIGHGGYPAGGSYQTLEIIEGKVSGNQITFTTRYLGPYNPGYTATVSGTINPDGSMNGTSPWEWHTTKGKVTLSSGSTSWPGLLKDEIQPFTFKTNPKGSGSWHYNLRDEADGFSVWINGGGGTVLVSDNVPLNYVETDPPALPTITGVEDGKTYYYGVTPITENGTATINGQTFTSGSTVSDEGTYKIIVDNGNGDSVSATFTIIIVESKTVEDPTPAKINADVIQGLITISGADPTQTPQATINTDYTLDTGNASMTIPSGTQITPTSGGTIDITSLNTQNIAATIRNDVPNSKGAIKVGIPSQNLTFSQPVTVTMDVDPNYNGKTLKIYSRPDSGGGWTYHGTCSVSGGKCTFTTLHATEYTGNYEVSNGPTPLDTNLDINATISISCDDTVNMATIIGTGYSGSVTGPGATNEADCNIKTINSAGYQLAWQASTAYMENANSDQIAGYTPASAGTPETWSVEASMSEWGARVKSTSDDPDLTTGGIWDNTDTYAGTFLNVGTSSFTVANRSTETDQVGSDETIIFGAEIGSNKFQPTGTYTTNVTMTATTL